MYETAADSAHHRVLVSEQVRAVHDGKRAWGAVSPDAIGPTWAEQIPSLAASVAGGQREVAGSSLVAAAGALEEQRSWAAPKGFVDATRFGGLSMDGYSLQEALVTPAIRAKQAIGKGLPPVAALERAEATLTMMLTSLLADTARSAASVMTVARPGTGYVRVVHGDACGDCLILAGKFYRWNQGFLRHPNCNCSHVSAHLSADQARKQGMFDDPYEAFKSMSEAEQDKKFGRARAEAIRDGADMFQVVSSRRGMTPNGLFTTEGMTRGHAAKGLKPGQRRATPELIYRWAGGDKGKALELLKEHGYILPGGQNPLGSLRGQREGFGAMGRGGTRKAASQAVLEARRTGIRDPRSRYTMTAAELRVHDAERDWLKVLRGENPWASGGFGNTPDPYGAGLNITGGSTPSRLTPKVAAAVEKRYLQTLNAVTLP